MELLPSSKMTVRHQFDSYCKKVLRGECRDYIREITRQAKHKVNFSEMTVENLNHLNVIDEYPSEYYHFQVLGYDIAIKNERIGLALLSLPVEKRDIILLSYYLNMTDREIGEELNMMLYTVQRRRTKSLKEIKKQWRIKILRKKRKNNHALLSFPIIEAAADGNVEAIKAVLKHFEGYITSLCTRRLYDENGVSYLCVDFEMRGRLETKLITKILDFKVA